MNTSTRQEYNRCDAEQAGLRGRSAYNNRDEHPVPSNSSNRHLELLVDGDRERDETATHEADVSAGEDSDGRLPLNASVDVQNSGSDVSVIQANYPPRSSARSYPPFPPNLRLDQGTPWSIRNTAAGLQEESALGVDRWTQYTRYKQPFDDLQRKRWTDIVDADKPAELEDLRDGIRDAMHNGTFNLHDVPCVGPEYGDNLQEIWYNEADQGSDTAHFRTLEYEWMHLNGLKHICVRNHAYDKDEESSGIPYPPCQKPGAVCYYEWCPAGIYCKQWDCQSLHPIVIIMFAQAFAKIGIARLRHLAWQACGPPCMLGTSTLPTIISAQRRQG